MKYYIKTKEGPVMEDGYVMTFDSSDAAQLHASMNCTISYEILPVSNAHQEIKQY